MTANTSWLRLLQNIMVYGKDLRIRDMECREIISNTVVLDMAESVITVKRRNLSYKHLINEALWILDGMDDLATIQTYAKSYAKYSDDGMSLYGAYGPRFRQQFQGVVASLAKDSFTRQAVLSLWRVNPRQSADIPCTLSLQFLVRGDFIHCVTTMRSNDAWLGFPYDVFCFSMMTVNVSLELARLTGKTLELGNLHLNVGSHHIYRKHHEKVKEILYSPKAFWEIMPLRLHGLNSPDHFKDTLRDILEGRNYEGNAFSKHLWTIVNPNPTHENSPNT